MVPTWCNVTSGYVISHELCYHKCYSQFALHQGRLVSVKLMQFIKQTFMDMTICRHLTWFLTPSSLGNHTPSFLAKSVALQMVGHV